MDADFYRHYLPDNEAICSALESGELDQAANLLLAYLDRSEDNLSDVHGTGAG
jgi:DNA-binding FadR family transcriptional regulator